MGIFDIISHDSRPSTRNLARSCRRIHSARTCSRTGAARHPPPHQLELRAYSMEPHGISSKLLPCNQGHDDAYPDSGAGTIRNSGWLARRPVPISLLCSSLSSCSHPRSLPRLGPRDRYGWMGGYVLTHRHGCCPAVRLSCQSQCSSHEAVPVSSPSHPFCCHRGFPRTDSSQRPPLVSTSHLPMPG